MSNECMVKCYYSSAQAGRHHSQTLVLTSKIKVKYFNRKNIRVFTEPNNITTVLLLEGNHSIQQNYIESLYNRFEGAL